MLGKFKTGWDFLLPLISHCLVHAAGTFLIILYVTRDYSFSALMALVDLVVHFTMDRLKAGPKYLGRYKDMMDRKFWWCLGFDQMIHHLTHYLIIYLTLTWIMEQV